MDDKYNELKVCLIKNVSGDLENHRNFFLMDRVEKFLSHHWKTNNFDFEDADRLD